MFEHAMAVARGSAQVLGDQRAVRFAERQDAPRGIGGLRAHLGDAAQEGGLYCWLPIIWTHTSPIL